MEIIEQIVTVLVVNASVFLVGISIGILIIYIISKKWE